MKKSKGVPFTKEQCEEWWPGLFYESSTGRVLLRDSDRYKKYVNDCKTYSIYPDDVIEKEELGIDFVLVNDMFGNPIKTRVDRRNRIQEKRNIARQGRDNYMGDIMRRNRMECQKTLIEYKKAHPVAKGVAKGTTDADEFLKKTTEEKFKAINDTKMTPFKLSELFNSFAHKWENEYSIDKENKESLCGMIDGLFEIIPSLQNYLLSNVFDDNTGVGDFAVKGTSAFNLVWDFVEVYKSLPEINCPPSE